MDKKELKLSESVSNFQADGGKCPISQGSPYAKKFSLEGR